jgi:cytochrome c
MRHVRLLGFAIVAVALADESGMAPGSQASSRMSSGDRPHDNEPPVVAIVQPDPSRPFGWGAQFRYVITVSDREDGESAFGEIKAHEVLLEVEYLPATDRDEASIPAGPDEPAGLALMRKSTCFTCHADKTSLVGPSLAAIAGKHGDAPEAIDRLARHVREGSSGTWGTLPMPPHSHFTPSEAVAIVRYVLDQGQQRHRWVHPGLEGVVRIVDRPDDTARGRYRLTASYLDNGTAGVLGTGTRGEHSITLDIR